LTIKNGNNIKYECSNGNLTKSALAALDKLYGKDSTWNYISNEYDGGIAGFMYDYLIYVDFNNGKNDTRNEAGTRELGVGYLENHTYSDDVNSLDNSTKAQRKALLEFLKNRYTDGVDHFTFSAFTDAQSYWLGYYIIAWASKSGITELKMDTASSSVFSCFKKVGEYTLEEIKCGYSELNGWNIYYYYLKEDGGYSKGNFDASSSGTTLVNTRYNYYSEAKKEAEEYLNGLKKDKSDNAEKNCKNNYNEWKIKQYKIIDSNYGAPYFRKENSLNKEYFDLFDGIVDEIESKYNPAKNDPYAIKVPGFVTDQWFGGNEVLTKNFDGHQYTIKKLDAN
jgi:hypothetical protein